MLFNSSSFRRASSGFGLVEVMVGMVIGMLGIIIMMQVSTLFGAQKRTTSAGSDALSSGAVTMYNLQREIGLAGYGFSSYSLLGCDVQLLNGTTISSIAPVQINYTDSAHPLGFPSVDANTDTILVAYTRSDKQTMGAYIWPSPNAGTYAVEGPFAANDVVIPQLVPPPPPQSTRPACTSANKLSMLTVSATASGSITTTPTTGPVFPNGGGQLYNLGSQSQIVVQAYVIRNSVLTRCDLLVSDCFGGSTTDPTIWVPIAYNIVSMKAQYGVDPNFPETLSSYVAVNSATGQPNFQNTPIPNPNPSGFVLTPPSNNANCMWARVPAVRIALVARSSQIEKTAVTGTAPTWAGNATDVIDLSGTTTPTGTTWQNFRYSLFENTIPLRNIVWMGLQTGSNGANVC